MMVTDAIKANLNFDSEEHPYVKPAKLIKDEGALTRFQSTS